MGAVTGPPFALTFPEMLIVLSMTGMAGVTSTWTAAEAVQGRAGHTARFGILQEIVSDVPDCCADPQLPVPLLTWAVGGLVSPVLGNPRTVKTTRLALSGPVLMMLKVNWV